MPYNTLSIGDIILVPFPFTDLSSTKSRPVVVLSLKNSSVGDFIVGAISSQKSIKNEDIIIDNNSLKKGSLPVTSFFKIGKLATLHSSLIQKKIAVLEKKIREEILRKTQNLF